MNRITFSLVFLFIIQIGVSQSVSTSEQTENVWYSNQKTWRANMQADLKLSAADFAEFIKFNEHEFFADRSAFFRKGKHGELNNDSAVNYFKALTLKYKSLYTNFKTTKASNPQYIKQQILEENDSKFHKPTASCNAACDNIGFENGNLSGWSACYATNTATSSTDFSTSTFTCTGVLSNVTKSAYDPSTATYQVSLMSGAGVDPLVGGAIPLVPPGGGKYSARIGDSTVANYGVAQLSNSFLVSAASPILTLQYAVVLENPSHTYSQQPWFQMQVLDQNGNEISACGQFFVVSGSGAKGFHSIYYATDADSVYYKPWTTVYVPLYKYVGQCVTVVFKSADCALGGHFGYAYVDASCSSFGVVTSSPGYCGQNEITLTAPPGSASYSWLGSCLNGPTNQQSVQVNCAGTFSVITGDKAQGCVDTLSLKVNTVTGPPPKPFFTFDTVCQGKPVAFVNKSNPISGAKFYWDFFSNGKINDSTTNPTFVFPAPGIYTVTLTENLSSGCATDTTLKVIVPPSVATIKGLAYHCANIPFDTLVASSGISYSWSTGSTKSFIAVAPTVTTTYTVTVKTGSCSATGTFAVGFDPAITSTVSAVSNVTCTGSCNGKATVTASGGTTPYTYKWHTLPTEVTAAVTNLCAGVDTVVVTDADGCTTINKVTITQPAPVLTVSSNQVNPKCSGGTGSAWGIVSGGTLPYKYSWSPSGGTKDTSTALAAGVYTLTVLDNSGKCGAVVVSIVAPPALTATASIIPPDCGVSDGEIKINTNGGTLPYKYVWSPNVSTTDSAVNLSAGNYTITVSDKNNCSATPIDIVLNSLGAVIAIKTTELTCNGNKTGVATATLTGGNPPFKYSWSSGSTASVKDSGLAAGTYSVTITDSLGCKATSAFTITQPNVLTVTITTTGACAGAKVGTATATPSGGTATYTYLWSGGNGTNAKAINLGPGPYTVNVTDFNGCTATATATVATSASTLRDSIVSSTNEACYGTCTASATVGVKNGTTPYTYLWSNGGKAAKDSNMCAGSFSVNITDANGCKSSATVVIKQPTPIRDSIASYTNEACFGDCDATAIDGVKNGVSPYKYFWTLNTSTTNKATGLCVGTYTVRVTDANGCKDSSKVTITQPSQLIVKTSSTNAICGSNNGAISLGVSGGTAGYTYAWSNTQTTQSITNLNAGTYSVTVTDANSCVSTATVNVSSTGAFAVSVCCDTTIELGQSVQLSISSSVGNTNYQWLPTTGLTCNTCPNPVANPTTTTTYTVIVVDSNGCGVADSVTINVLGNTIHIYNALTPNGDGKDDFWKIGGIELFPDNEVTIFSRWGIEVWHGTGYNNANVSFIGIDEKGQDLPSGTYYYLLTVNGTKYKGWIQLMR